LSHKVGEDLIIAIAVVYLCLLAVSQKVCSDVSNP
jgi:hypothetical protein